MIQEISVARQRQPSRPQHVAMKDPAFAWPFDDLGQFTGDIELRTAERQPHEARPARSPATKG